MQSIWLGRIDGKEPTLLWVEKSERGFVLRTAPAAALAAKVTAGGGTGSIDPEATSLVFGDDPASMKADLPNKPADLAFADFNGDGIADLVDLLVVFRQGEPLPGHGRRQVQGR